MGHVVNPSSGALAFNNSPSTVADLNRLSERIEEVGTTWVADVAALENVAHPREGEIRRVSADDTYWGFNGSGWERIYRPDGSSTLTTLTATSATVKRTGNLVQLNIVSATLSSGAWGPGSIVCAITDPNYRPLAEAVGSAFNRTTGGVALAKVNVAGQVLLYGVTTVAAVDITVGWIRP